MKNAIAMIVFLGAVGYVGYEASIGPCDKPIEYSIGVFSTNFGINQDDFKARITAAENIWEQALGKPLFVYKENASFKINLIYDERQKLIDQKQKTEFGLSAAENNFKHEDALFNNLKSQYEAALSSHNTLVKAYESHSAAYESQISYWNSRGGAPQGEYQKLESERQNLNLEVQQINQDATRLNTLLKKLNTQLEIRNTSAREYNTMVKNYNQKYQGGLEFDQAEYKGSMINVYEFKNNTDLTIALAHELGHALGMNHVENQASILYYLTGNQTLSPTSEDIAELKRACGKD